MFTRIDDVFDEVLRINKVVSVADNRCSPNNFVIINEAATAIVASIVDIAAKANLGLMVSGSQDCLNIFVSTEAFFQLKVIGNEWIVHYNPSWSKCYIRISIGDLMTMLSNIKVEGESDE